MYTYNVNGSFDTFAKETNVDVHNRVICYDTHALGTQLNVLGMLIILDNILNRISKNRSNGRTTYIFIDELYLFFKHKYTTDCFATMWKRVRKYGAFATGITQNVSEIVHNDIAKSMIGNSEYVVMLRQSTSDRIALSQILSVSENRLINLSTAEAGTGLLKIGNSIIPYEDNFPKNTELYKLMSTKPREYIE